MHITGQGGNCALPTTALRPSAPDREPSTIPARTTVPTAVAAPAANATVVDGPTAIPTLATKVASSVTVITAADIEREHVARCRTR
jgi:hypothetical protein